MLHEIKGVVLRGKGLGRTIGFPTANLSIQDATHIPAGVYAAQAQAEGIWYPALVNVGVHPTVPEGPPTVEAYLVGCALDLYGKTIVLRLFHFLRQEQRFPSVDALRQQLELDLATLNALDMPRPEAKG